MRRREFITLIGGMAACPVIALAWSWGTSPLRSKVVMIEKAGHLPHLEQPETAAKAVQEFVGR